MQSSESALSPAGLSRRVVRLALPAVGEQVLTLTVGIVNTALVGHLSAASLTAVGLASTITGISHILFSAVGTGATALVAQATGAGDRSLANRTLAQALMVALALGLLATAILQPLGKSALLLMGAEGETVPLGVGYLRYVAASLPLAALMGIGNGALRGSGDTRTPMAVMTGVNVLNLALSYGLIRGAGPFPELGVIGAAIAATTSMSLGGLAVLVILISGRANLVLRPIVTRPDRVLLARLIRVGLPAGGESLLMQCAFLAYARSISSLGTVAYAAYLVAQRIESLNTMPAMGFSIAAMALSGQAVGAGDPALARRSVFASIRMSLGLAAICATMTFLAPRFLLARFTNDPAVIAQGIAPLRWIAFAQPTMSLAMGLAGGLRGAGDTRSVMVVTGVGAWCVRVPLAILSVTLLNFGLPGVQASMMLDWLARAIMLAWRFRPASWFQRVARATAELSAVGAGGQ